jgi:hypothetical protein
MTLSRRAARALCLLGCTCIVAAPGSVGAQTGFPQAWVGKWAGTLTTLVPPDSVRNRIPISLEIAPLESDPTSFQWRTIFNADTVRGLRPYRLIVEDAKKGKYATDESNGVVLDESYIGGVLTSVFQVQTQVLESRYFLRGDTLTHELSWWNTAPTRTVTGSGANSESGSEIRSFRVLGMQRAVMVRQRP